MWVYAKGANVDALRESAHRMTHFGDEVDEIRSTANRAVRAMQRVWAGPDLQPVLERWRRVEHELHVISKNFDATSRRLHHNVDAQRRSSGLPAGGHGGGSHGGGRGGAGHGGHSIGHAGGGSGPGHAAGGAGFVAPAGGSWFSSAGHGDSHVAYVGAVGHAIGLSSGAAFAAPTIAHFAPQAHFVSAASHWLGLGWVPTQGAPAIR